MFLTWKEPHISTKLVYDHEIMIKMDSKVKKIYELDAELIRRGKI